MSATPHAHTILYAEDDHDDLFMVKLAFEKYEESVNLLHAHDGYEALEQLKKAFLNKTSPCLIILDINMPGMDGREALVNIKQTEIYKDIPVVLFTTSSSDGDKAFAQKWGAEFITKPLIFSELQKLAETFLHLCTSSVSANA
jgi:CheY-like chemotaxis protein